MDLGRERNVSYRRAGVGYQYSHGAGERGVKGRRDFPILVREGWAGRRGEVMLKEEVVSMRVVLWPW